MRSARLWTTSCAECGRDAGTPATRVCPFAVSGVSISKARNGSCASSGLLADRRYPFENLSPRFNREEECDDRTHQRKQPKHHKHRIDAEAWKHPADNRRAYHRRAALPRAGNAATKRAQMGRIDLGCISRE